MAHEPDGPRTGRGWAAAVSAIKSLRIAEFDGRIVTTNADPLSAGFYLADAFRVVPKAKDPEFNVTLTGNVEAMFDARPFFSAVRELLDEGEGARALFEYLYMRKPILALTLPGLTSEILSRSRLGMAVDPNDQAGIKKAARSLPRVAQRSAAPARRIPPGAADRGPGDAVRPPGPAAGLRPAP